MENPLIKTVKEQWSRIAHQEVPAKSEVELAFYKKLLSIFQVGDFYFFIFLPGSHNLEFVSPHLERVLGYRPEEFTIDSLMEKMHPEDLPNFIEFEKKVVAFKTSLPPDKVMKYKSQYNYRIRKKDGSYLPILQQSITILANETGAALRNFVVHTDISSLRPSTEMSLSFIGLEAEPSFLNVLGSEKKIKSPRPLFTNREKEILLLLAKRMSTEDIAQSLFISPQTVRTHRKNIHAKAKTHTVLELIIKSMEEGWV